MIGARSYSDDVFNCVLTAGIFVRRTLCVNKEYHVSRFDRWNSSVDFILDSC